MSGYRLCQVPLAEKPFYIECIGMNAFSIEEICYFIYHQIALLDDSIISRELCEWFSNELHLVRLGQSMERALEENRSLAAFIMPVFREVSYLTHEEADDFAGKLEDLTKDPLPVRLKKKGDALVRCGKMGGAVLSYRQALDTGEKDLKAPFLSSVWHNMGVAHMNMLQYDEGLSCLERAYGLLHTKNSLKSYLYAYALTKPKEKYDLKLREMKVDDQTAEEIAGEIAEASDQEEESVSDIDSYLDQLTKEYHYATDA